MNRYQQFRRLLPSERRVYGEVMQVRADGTTIVQTPEGRTLRARGGGVPPGNFAFVRIRSGRQPEMDGTAPALPVTQFDNL